MSCWHSRPKPISVGAESCVAVAPIENGSQNNYGPLSQLSRASWCLPGNRCRSRQQECTPHRVPMIPHRPHTPPCTETCPSWYREKNGRCWARSSQGNDRSRLPPTSAPRRTDRPSPRRTKNSPLPEMGDLLYRKRCCPTRFGHRPAWSHCWASMQPSPASLHQSDRATSCLGCRHA